jgi:spermidine synthase
MGMVFPLLLQGRRSVDQQPAQVVGWLYAVNAMAGAVGAVVGGIVFPRTVGTLQGFICLTGCAALGALGCGVAAKPKTRPRVLGEWAAAGGTIAALAWLFPSSLLHHPKAEAEVLRHEDEYGMQIVTRTAEGYLKVRNNQTFIAYKFGHPSTSFAQEMIAYVSGLLSQECRDVLNIGTGYGITAGAFTLFDGIQRLRTVEILPLVYERQDLFREKNYAYYEDPAVERLCTDGRRLLATETDTYDVISVNVLDPYVPGSSGLFTTNFWDLAKSRLKSGGVYSQLIWSRDRDVLMRGLETVFAEIYAFPAYRGAYNIVAFPGDPPGAFFMERLTPAIEQSLESMTERPARAFLDEIFAERAAWKRTKPLSKRSYLGALLHTDDTPILEYQWAHGNDRISMFDSLQAFDYE